MFNYIGLIVLGFLCGAYVGGRFGKAKWFKAEVKTPTPQILIQDMGDLQGKNFLVKLPPGCAVSEAEVIRDYLKGFLEPKGADCIIIPSDTTVETGG